MNGKIFYGISIVLYVGLFALSSLVSVHAKDNEKGTNGELSYSNLLSMIENGKTIDGYIIKGNDLISVIRKTRHKIDIIHSIISGGLNFTQLPEKKLTIDMLPSLWSAEQKQSLIESKANLFRSFYYVNNPINLIDSDIQINPIDYRSVIAERTIFFEKVCFEGSTFIGDSQWNDAIFIQDLMCHHIQFQGKAYFTDAFFYGVTDFQEAFFGSHGAIFIKSKFYSNLIRFSQAHFLSASFRDAIFSGEADFSKALFEHEAYFADVTFHGDVNFSESDFKNAVFMRSLFNGRAMFQKILMEIASFQSSIFKKNAFFNQAAFTGTVYFNQTQFNQQVDFSDCQFKCTGIHFKQAKFFADTLFIKTLFQGPVIFSKIKSLGNQFNCQQSTFLDNLYFDNATLQSHEIDFHDVVVHGMLTFQGTVFEGNAIFSQSRFFRRADFSEATFQSEADFFQIVCQLNAFFAKATFMGDAEFSQTQFNEHADFSSTSFHQLTDFSDTIFKGNVDFAKSCFQGDTRFRNVSFIKEAGFHGATFHDKIDFFESKFNQLAYFRSSQFFQVIQIKNVIFSGYIDFRNCLIKKLDMYCQKSPTIVKNRMDFRNAWIGSAHFQDVIFEDDVDFSCVIFGGMDKTSDADQNTLVFRFVTFEADTSFIRSTFTCDLALEMICAKGFVNFRDVQFQDEKRTRYKVLLSYLNLSNIHIQWQQLPKLSRWVRSEEERIYSFADKELFVNQHGKEKKISIELNIEPISEVLRMFEQIFQNQLADKNDVIYLRECVELAESRQKGEWSFHRIQMELLWLFWGMTTGYGTKIWWIIGWCCFYHFLFTSIYWWNGILIRTTAENKDEHDHTFKQRVLDLPRLYLTERRFIKMPKGYLDRWVNAMRFSYVILFKFGYRDTTISGNFFGIDYAIIVWIEWVLGFFLISYLAVTLSNTMPLVNRLISGVF